MPRYEFSVGSSNKFWEIKLSGTSFTTTYGKIGANGQTTIKEFESPIDAKREYDKLVAEKTKKGYTLASGSGATAAKPDKTPAKPEKPAKPAAPAGGMYFEFVEGSSSKFWEIVLDGVNLTTRYGKIGTDGQSTPKTFGTAGEAKVEHDKLVAEKTKKGYKLVRGEAPAAPVSAHAHDAKLEAAIEAAPDDVDGYLVYADWLQGQGDLRGEMIALQARNKLAPAKKLLADNLGHFFGELAGFLDIFEPYDGETLGAPTLWRWGYLEKLWISLKNERSKTFSGKLPHVVVPEALDAMLAHASTRFLRELTVGIVSYEGNSYAEIAKVIGKHPLPTLKKLVLGDFYYEETELNWSKMGNIEPIYKAVPNLESLILRSGTMKVGAIDLPKLRELQIISGGLDQASFASILGAKFPLLERLNLQLGEDLKWKLADLQPIFDGTLFPKLKHLGLGNSPQGDEICQAIAASRIAAQLESLDMAKGTMGDIGAAALAAGKLPKLALLDVTKCYLSDVGVQSIAKVAKTVIDDDQQEDDCEPDERYISGRE
jgi:uncharacterized protein (TIGR02996 family)